MTVNPDVLLKEAEVERDYHLTVPWQRKKRRHGGGPAFVRLGKMIRYRRGDVEEFIARHRVQAKADSLPEVQKGATNE